VSAAATVVSTFYIAENTIRLALFQVASAEQKKIPKGQAAAEFGQLGHEFFVIQLLGCS
jgi:hypothetical protein